MTPFRLFEAQLLSDGYELETFTTVKIPDNRDKEQIVLGQPFSITIEYDPEYFGIGLPMTALDAQGKPMVSTAFFYDSERMLKIHLYKDGDTAHLVERYTYANGAVRYAVSLFRQR